MCSTVTPEELQEKFKTVDYIYFDNPTHHFLKDFASVFAGDLKPELKDIQQKMFRVTPEGKLKPVN